jgi:thymidylate synthase
MSGSHALFQFYVPDGDLRCQLYSSYIEQTQLAREPRRQQTMTLNPAVTKHFAFRSDDSALGDDEPYADIKAPVAV